MEKRTQRPLSGSMKNFGVPSSSPTSAFTSPPESELSVKIDGPIGNVLVEFTTDDAGKFSVRYNPVDAGDHHIELIIRGKSILSNPIPAVCWDKPGNVPL
eukprot:TRINITY_DN2493_c0_g1_i11.p1 TRINITY_DN2493_c0_g1~~TRINITY_DN2493_c0_g1_i11.p1  ORF type:complete len:100 (+),score=39.93 TRINITY_DN2493_c0_g1_i11:217-516(+)